MAIRILVANKTLGMVDLVRNTLAPLGHEVMSATSLALALFLSQKSPPALIVSGLELQDAAGFEFINEIKADHKLKLIPFIFVAEGHEDEALHEEALKLGAIKFIDRRIKGNDLLREIESYLVELRLEIVSIQPNNRL